MKRALAILSIVTASIAVPMFTDYEVIHHQGGTGQSWTPSGTKSGSPALVDWNNDGRIDVLMGYLKTPSGAGMSISLNSGTNEEPIFETPESAAYPITGV